MATEKFPPDPESPFMEHLKEVRDRLVKVVITIFVIFICLFPFASEVFQALAAPLLSVMPVGATMISIDPIAPFLTPLKTILALAICIGIPVVLYHAWAFIAPGLYKHEKRLAFPLVLSSTLLFYTGMAFAYFVVFPLVFSFLQGVAPEGVSAMPDIDSYLGFVIKIFFAFGIAFEVPIATILVIKTGMMTVEKLKEKRPYVFVGAFVLGMLLTPPDVISQTLLAIPMWLLFEVGLIFSKYFTSEKTEEERAEEKAAEQSDGDAP
ncbi:MAG: twin-arginine translocase subunit TatC [Gammaproteobacteria bacterium]|nr:twin-arginine translocase subunit TatC [Gammaproteobacteria bacterium]PCH64661.1 MAG: twin-arginine translocase subunit TatC [Gammaproteobacteria bacterium]